MPRERVAGVVLAGGQARRLGRDKAVANLGGRPLAGRVLDRLRGQAMPVAINANGDPTRLAGLGVPVIADSVDGGLGPLAGILTALEWAAAVAPDARWLVSVPTDTPFLPPDLVARLVAAVADEGAQVGCARSGGRVHPVVGLWPLDLASGLRTALVDRGVRRVERWIADFHVAYADWPLDPVDPFLNVNTADDLMAAQRIIDAGGRA